MSRGLASLVQALGATMGGYAQGRQMYNAEQRRQKQAAHEDEEYQYNKDKRAKADALDADIGAAMADRQLETIQPPADDAMGNPDMAMVPPQATQYKVGDQTYADEGQARAALMGVNSKAAKYQRAAQAAAVHGAAGVDKAAQYDAFAKQALNEGSDQILTALQSAAPSLANVKKAGGMVAGTVGQQAADVFNQTGGRWKVGADTATQYYVDKDAAGREFVNFRVLGKDGKPVVDDGVHTGLMLQDYKTRLEAQRADTQADQKRQELDLQGLRLGEEMRNNQALRGIQSRQVAVQEANSRREADQFAATTPAGKIAAIEQATGTPLSADQKMGLLGVSRLSEPDQLTVKSLLKQQEQLDQAKAKAMAEGMWNPNSDGARQMATDAAAIGLKLNNVLGKYGSDKGKNSDPLGILGDDPARATPAARGVGKAPVRAPAPVPAGPANGEVDVRNDPTLVALREGIAKLQGKTDPQSVQQLMALGTAKNERIAQLQQQNGAMTRLITD